MSPDRGAFTPPSPDHGQSDTVDDDGLHRTLPPGRSFTVRGVLVGLVVGLVICFSNMYFGLQTGWVSTMTMPASLMGFGIFKALRPHLRFPFSPVENVLVQTVAGSMAIMPLGCGFVGVIPAMNYLLTPEEQGPIHLSQWKLVLWSLGLCYFGVVFAVPLRHQVIIRERLRFPSGFSTAVLIGVLHSQTPPSGSGASSSTASGGFASLVPDSRQSGRSAHGTVGGPGPDEVESPLGGGPAEPVASKTETWAEDVKLLVCCFAVSGVFAFANYFFPVLRSIPIFGHVAAKTWLWTFNPSLAYVGQGIIMGPETTLHMLLGAVIGWAVLSPLAYYKGWAPGHINDWETGSKGWIVWISLAIMLSDAVVSLGYLCCCSLLKLAPEGWVARFKVGGRNLGKFKDLLMPSSYTGYSTLQNQDESSVGHDPASSTTPSSLESTSSDSYGDDELIDDEKDAPSHQLISGRVVWLGLLLSIVLCVCTINIVFGHLVPLYATIVAVAMALLLSIMGVRALGETDLNPVSGISKLAQLFFAIIIPQSNRSSVLINLVAGAVSEAGALQAGDLMQDLKTGHLLGAAPIAQFWGQVIGATAGAVVSAFIYRLYTEAYQIPGELFQVPTGYVWIFTARLVTGKGLPYMAREWAAGAAVLFAITTSFRTATASKTWRCYIPGGIAVAVGMYNVPSFTLARALGGILSWYWASTKRSHTSLIIVASGFILGEGFLSIVNLTMQTFGVPHF